MSSHKSNNTHQLLQDAYSKITLLTRQVNDFNRPIYGQRAMLEQEIASCKSVNQMLADTCTHFQRITDRLLVDQKRLHAIFELFNVPITDWDKLEYTLTHMKHMSEHLPILHTSDEWCKLTGTTVLDPDGWDRSNYLISWNELITRDEFDKRVSRSTVQLLAIEYPILNEDTK